jgi:hypothetical protein
LWLATCDQILVATLGGVDTAESYYYDPATSELIAISVRTNLTETCIAGESLPPACNDPNPLSLCP